MGVEQRGRKHAISWLVGALALLLGPVGLAAALGGISPHAAEVPSLAQESVAVTLALPAQLPMQAGEHLSYQIDIEFQAGPARMVSALAQLPEFLTWPESTAAAALGHTFCPGASPLDLDRDGCPVLIPADSAGILSLTLVLLTLDPGPNPAEDQVLAIELNSGGLAVGPAFAEPITIAPTLVEEESDEWAIEEAEEDGPVLPDPPVIDPVVWYSLLAQDPPLLLRFQAPMALTTLNGATLDLNPVKVTQVDKYANFPNAALWPVSIRLNNTDLKLGYARDRDTGLTSQPVLRVIPGNGNNNTVAAVAVHVVDSRDSLPVLGQAGYQEFGLFRAADTGHFWINVGGNTYRPLSISDFEIDGNWTTESTRDWQTTGLVPFHDKIKPDDISTWQYGQETVLPQYWTGLTSPTASGGGDFDYVWSNVEQDEYGTWRAQVAFTRANPQNSSGKFPSATFYIELNKTAWVDPATGEIVDLTDGAGDPDLRKRTVGDLRFGVALSDGDVPRWGEIEEWTELNAEQQKTYAKFMQLVDGKWYWWVPNPALDSPRGAFNEVPISIPGVGENLIPRSFFEFEIDLGNNGDGRDRCEPQFGVATLRSIGTAPGNGQTGPIGLMESIQNSKFDDFAGPIPLAPSCRADVIVEKMERPWNYDRDPVANPDVPAAGWEFTVTAQENIQHALPPDPVEVYPTRAAFPAVGQPDRFYIAEDTDFAYRWRDGAYRTLSANWGRQGGSITRATDGDGTANTPGDGRARFPVTPRGTGEPGAVLISEVLRADRLDWTLVAASCQKLNDPTSPVVAADLIDNPTGELRYDDIRQADKVLCTYVNQEPAPIPDLHVTKMAHDEHEDELVGEQDEQARQRDTFEEPLVLTETGLTAPQPITARLSNTGEEPLTRIVFSDETLGEPAITDWVCAYQGQPLPTTTLATWVLDRIAANPSAFGLLRPTNDPGIPEPFEPFELPVGETITCQGTLPGFAKPIDDEDQRHINDLSVFAEGALTGEPVADIDGFEAEAPTPQPGIEVRKERKDEVVDGYRVPDSVTLVRNPSETDPRRVVVEVQNTGNEPLTDLVFADETITFAADPEFTGPAVVWHGCLVGASEAELPNAAGPWPVLIEPETGALLLAAGGTLLLAPGHRLFCAGTLPPLVTDQVHEDQVTVTGTGVVSGTPVFDEDGWVAETGSEVRFRLFKVGASVSAVGNGLLLDGSVFELFDQAPGELTSALQVLEVRHGVLTIQVPPGRYWLLETQAPANRSLFSGVIEFTVYPDGTIELHTDHGATVTACQAPPVTGLASACPTALDLPPLEEYLGAALEDLDEGFLTGPEGWPPPSYGIVVVNYAIETLPAVGALDSFAAPAAAAVLGVTTGLLALGAYAGLLVRRWRWSPPNT